MLRRLICVAIGHRLDATPWLPQRYGYAYRWGRSVWCRRCGRREASWVGTSKRPLDVIEKRR